MPEKKKTTEERDGKELSQCKVWLDTLRWIKILSACKEQTTPEFLAELVAREAIKFRAGEGEYRIVFEEGK